MHDFHSHALTSLSLKLSEAERGLLSIEERRKSKEDVIKEALSLPGVGVGKELWEVAVEVCGASEVKEKCGAADMLAKWYDTGERRRDDALGEKEDERKFFDLGLGKGFGWIRKRVKNLGKHEEAARASSDDSAAPRVRMDLGEPPAPGMQGGINFVDSSPATSRPKQPSVAGRGDGMGGVVMEEYFDGGRKEEGRRRSDHGIELQESVKGPRPRKSSTSSRSPGLLDDFDPSRVTFVRALSGDGPGLLEDDEDEEDDVIEEESESDHEDLADPRMPPPVPLQERRRSSPTIDIVKVGGSDGPSSADATPNNSATTATTPSFTPPFAAASSSLKIKSLKAGGSGPDGVLNEYRLGDEQTVRAEGEEKGLASAQERKRIDRTWMLGSTPPCSIGPEPWKKVGGPWSTHMVLLSELKGRGKDGQPVSAIRAMSTTPQESLLATGSRNGEVLIWDLRCHPPQVKSRHDAHRISRPGEYYRPEVHELYDEGDLKTGEVLQIELADQGGRGTICDGNLHVFDVETNKPLAVLKRNISIFGGGGVGGSGGGGGGGGLGWFGGLDESGDAALGAFGLSTGGLMGGVGGGRSYDMMVTENDPIVAFQTLPLGGGGAIGGGFTQSGEETKRGQRMVCVSSDRLHHIDLREANHILGNDRGILTLPAGCVFKNNCQACAGVGTMVPRKLCTRHPHPFSLTLGGSWLLNTNGWGIIETAGTVRGGGRAGGRGGAFGVVERGNGGGGGGDSTREGAGGESPRGGAGGLEGFTRIGAERGALGNLDEEPKGELTQIVVRGLAFSVSVVITSATQLTHHLSCSKFLGLGLGGGSGSNMIHQHNSTNNGQSPIGLNTCLAVQCEGGGGAAGGSWICVGRSDGVVVCVEGRMGSVLNTWKAHDDSVVQIYCINANQVVTVGKDKRAILWDLRGGGVDGGVMKMSR